MYNEERLYQDLPRHVKDMSAEELQIYFPPNTPKAYLMRSIIMNERMYGTVNYDRTLRGMWYSTVKPTLDKLGLLEADDMTEEGLTKWDAMLSKYVADLLRKGYLTYKDLHIADVSRQKANPSEFYRTENITVYGHQITVAPYSNIIIATEKDTVYKNIADIAKLFGCSCISCKGQNSLGAMEVLVRGMKLEDPSEVFNIPYEVTDAIDTMKRHEWLLEYDEEDLDEDEKNDVAEYHKAKETVVEFLKHNTIVYDNQYGDAYCCDKVERPFTVHILTMTDYDPAGYYIAEALESQVKDILVALGLRYINVTIERVGITPDQLDPETVEANKYTPKPANIEKWFERTGGINGEPKGLELDALTPTQIRSIFVDNLMNYVDTYKYEEFLKESYIQKKVLASLSPFIDNIVKEVSKKHLDKVKLVKFSVRDLAVNGYSSFPIEELCLKDQDKSIHSEAVKYLKSFPDDPR